MSEQSGPTKIPTGVEGLDSILSGGLPAKRPILVVGGPGSGKSILCAQFLVSDDNDKGGVYVSLDYSKKSFLDDMLQFGWDFETLEKSGSFKFLDGSAIRRIPQTKNVEGTLFSTDDLSLEDMIDLISLYVDKVGVKKVVIDDLTSLVFRYPGDSQRRTAILSLIEALNEMNVSALIISEASMYDTRSEIKTEEFLSDGVIRMFMLKDGSRAIQISKMRGVAIDNKPHPYSIVDKTGIEVFPNETVFDT